MLGRIVRVLRPRGEDEVGESNREYRHAEDREHCAILCICSSISRLSFRGAVHARMIFRRVSSVFMSLAPCHDCSAARLRASPGTANNPPVQRGDEKAASVSPLLHHAFRNRSVVAIVVAAGPDSLPAPRCRLPTPARAAIEANAGDEWRRGKGEEAAIMESMETSERKPMDARCKSRPEREAAGADDSTAESGTAEAAP